MNRYILFFMLVSMQDSIILLAEESKKSTSFEELKKRGVDSRTPLEKMLYLKELLEHKVDLPSVKNRFEHLAASVNAALDKELEEKNNEIKTRYLQADLLEKIEGLLLNSKFLEIYPHYNSPRHNQTLNNIIDGKDHRGTTCPICSKTFEEIGNRVNLVCGHDICSHCLYVRKYQNHCHECPDQKCKHHINNADFSIQHLKNGKAVDIKLLNSINQVVLTAREITEKRADNFKYPYPNLENKHELARLERQEISIPNPHTVPSYDYFRHFPQ